MSIDAFGDFFGELGALAITCTILSVVIDARQVYAINYDNLEDAFNIPVNDLIISGLWCVIDKL